MRHTFKAALIAASSLSFSTAAAQSIDDEVIVTATRVETSAAELPAAVTVIDIDRARERGRATLDAALSDAPGIQAPRTGPVGQQASVFSGGFESNHTLVLFDGVRIDDPATPENVFDAGQDLLGDAARIEIVQGPMSALYGSGALGGVVNIVPRRGRAGRFNPRLEAAGGSFGTLTSTVGADGSLGRFRYAFTADSFASEGYDIVPERIATHTGEGDGAEMTTLTGVLDFAVTQGVSLDLLLRQRDARADYDPGFFGDIGENPDAEIRQNDTALWRLGVSWTPAADVSLRLSGGAFESDRVTADAGVAGDEYHGDRTFADALTTWRQRKWTLTLGAQIETEEMNALSFGSSVIGDQQHWAAYAGAQGEYGALNVTAALRRDDVEGFGAHTTWRAGISYVLSEVARLYAAYGTSFRAPSLYERFVPFFGAAGLKPEEALSWEIGGEAAFPLLARRNGAELTVLHRSSEIDDLIGFSGFSYANVDRAAIDFSEARIALHPFGWLTARASYADTNARDTATGDALQRRPRHAWSAAFQVERGPFIAEIAWREVGARRDTTYDDLGAFAGAGRVEAYDVVGASASWAVSDAVKFYVALDNVLDEIYEPVNGFAGAPANVLFGVRIDPSVTRYPGRQE